MLVTIYCSGSIQKGPSDKGKLCWTDVERAALAKTAQPIEVRFLNPDDPVDNLNNTVALFGRDMYQIQFADFVVVDARQRRGIGIGTEIVASRLLKTPLIAVVPRNTYYRQDKLSYLGSEVSDYIHPHLHVLVDAITDDFEAAGIWIKEYLSAPQQTLKSIDVIFEAIEKYKAEILPRDNPMLEILQEVEMVKQKPDFGQRKG